MSRILLDTNILISGTFWRGSPFLVVRRVIERETLLLSDEIITEFLTTASRIVAAVPLPDTTIRRAIEELREAAVIVRPARVPDGLILRDPADFHVVAAAVGGEAEYLVTGDRDLLDAEIHWTTRVVTPREFLQLVDG